MSSRTAVLRRVNIHPDTPAVFPNEGNSIAFCGGITELYSHTWAGDVGNTKPSSQNSRKDKYNNKYNSNPWWELGRLRQRNQWVKKLPSSKALSCPVPTDGPHLHECIKYYLSHSNKITIWTLNSRREETGFLTVWEKMQWTKHSLLSKLNSCKLRFYTFLN